MSIPLNSQLPLSGTLRPRSPGTSVPSTPTSALSSGVLPPLAQTPPGTFYPGMGVLIPNNSIGYYRRAPLTVPAKRACDGCHRRKVKCVGSDGDSRCINCVNASLECTYNSVPQKKGPKGVRAKVLCELRESQRKTTVALERAIVGPDGTLELPHCSLARHLAPTQGLLTPELIAFCSDFYFTHMQTAYPFFTKPQFGQIHGLVEQSIPAYCTITAFCAFVIIQSQVAIPPGLPTLPDIDTSLLGHIMVKEVTRVAKGLHDHEKLTLLDVYTPLFLHYCHSLCDLANNSFTFLRQAIANAHLLGLDSEEHYQLIQSQEVALRRRLYWILFVSERAFSLKHNHPPILDANVPFPSLDDHHPDYQMTAGLMHLADLYKLLDDEFFQLWMRPNRNCSLDWMVDLQTCLETSVPLSAMANNVLAESQIANLLLTKTWLQSRVWQLGAKYGLITTPAPHPCLELAYPFILGRDLIQVSDYFGLRSLDVHGLWAGAKLLDIGSSMVEIVHSVLEQGSTSTQELSVTESIHFILDMLSSIRDGSGWHIHVFMSKLAESYDSDGTPIINRLRLVLPILDPNSKVHASSATKVRSLDDLQHLRAPRCFIKGSRIFDEAATCDPNLILQDRTVSAFIVPSPDRISAPKVTVDTTPPEARSRSITPRAESVVSSISSLVASSHLNHDTVPPFQPAQTSGSPSTSPDLSSSLSPRNSLAPVPGPVPDMYSLNASSSSHTDADLMGTHLGIGLHPLSVAISRRDSPQEIEQLIHPYINPAWPFEESDHYHGGVSVSSNIPVNGPPDPMGSVPSNPPTHFGMQHQYPAASLGFLDPTPFVGSGVLTSGTVIHTSSDGSRFF